MFCTTLSLIWCNSYANEYNLAKNTCVKSEIKNDLLLIYKSDCKKGKFLLDKFQVPNDIPKLDYVFEEEINNKKYIFLSISYNDSYRGENNKINYADKYHLNYVYQCEKECKFDKKLSNFFGNGGDLIDIDTDKKVYIFPYSSEQSIKNELKSNLFKNWSNNQLKSGIVKNKTEIYREAGLNSEKSGYLISGDKFSISGVYSRWLNISYINKNHKMITGWIRCEDTNICS